MLARFGVTRVADITGLDRIGIPVAIAIRPCSRSVSVAAGKGADLVAAKVSAAMEAIECAHAEEIELPLVFASRSEIVAGRRAVDLDAMPRLKHHALGENSRFLWVEGRELSDSSPIMVPYELVHAHYCPPSLPHAGAFLATTNGLSSGNVLIEAISHALFEVIERDALSLWTRRSDAERAETQVNLRAEDVEDPLVGGALVRMEEARFAVAVWDITSDIGVPAFHCIMIDAADPRGHPGTGTGCHPDKRVALARALFEAVQVRAIYISGGRDDLPRGDYAAGHLQSFRSAITKPSGNATLRGFADLPSRTADTFEDDLGWALDRLAAAGCSPPIVVNLSRPDSGIAVARVIVPGLQGPPVHDVEPGRRALGSRA